MLRFTAPVVAGLGLLVGVSGPAAAQRQSQPDQAGQTSVTIEAKIGGKKYKGSGNGECKHAPDASIRGVSASLWMVQYGSTKDGSLKRLNLTLWRPKDGGNDQLSLSMETGSGSHRIEAGTEGENAGRGSVTVLPSGPGGRLEITGKEAGGKSVQVTIDCSAFAEVEAEGE
jgi:hypothetical protein